MRCRFDGTTSGEPLLGWSPVTPSNCQEWVGILCSPFTTFSGVPRVLFNMSVFVKDQTVTSDVYSRQRQKVVRPKAKSSTPSTLSASFGLRVDCLRAKQFLRQYFEMTSCSSFGWALFFWCSESPFIVARLASQSISHRYSDPPPVCARPGASTRGKPT